MSKRVRLPGADELFRQTKSPSDPLSVAPLVEPREPAPAVVAPSSALSVEESGKQGSSGRVRHDEKITIYVTADELLDLEHTRLSLRRTHGLAIDRGRIVREAIRLALESVEAEGDDSPLVRRLREQ